MSEQKIKTHVGILVIPRGEVMDPSMVADVYLNEDDVIAHPDPVQFVFGSHPTNKVIGRPGENVYGIFILPTCKKLSHLATNLMMASFESNMSVYATNGNAIGFSM